jgi:hypothetical protein
VVDEGGEDELVTHTLQHVRRQHVRRQRVKHLPTHCHTNAAKAVKESKQLKQQRSVFSRGVGEDTAYDAADAKRAKSP